MDTNTTPQKKSSSTIWWIMGALGVAAIFMLSSFKSGSAADTTTISPCASNPNCLKGYWKWQIIKGWYADIVKKATANNVTTSAQLDTDAMWIVSQNWKVYADFSDWEAMVNSEMVRVKAATPNYAIEDARVVAIENILTSLTK